LLLLRRQLGAATAAVAIDQAVHASQQKGPTPPIDAGRAQLLNIYSLGLLVEGISLAKSIAAFLVRLSSQIDSV
jgi:hypothetical protein